jgi:peptidoglycan hydrolase CwlO-like protein
MIKKDPEIDELKKRNEDLAAQLSRLSTSVSNLNESIHQEL